MPDSPKSSENVVNLPNSSTESKLSCSVSVQNSNIKNKFEKSLPISNGLRELPTSQQELEGQNPNSSAFPLTSKQKNNMSSELQEKRTLPTSQEATNNSDKQTKSLNGSHEQSHLEATAVENFLSTTKTNEKEKVSDLQNNVLPKNSGRNPAKGCSPLDEEAIRLSNQIIFQSQPDVVTNKERDIFSPHVTKALMKSAVTMSHRADATIGCSSKHHNLDQEAIALSSSILINTSDQEQMPHEHSGSVSKSSSIAGHATTFFSHPVSDTTQNLSQVSPQICLHAPPHAFSSHSLPQDASNVKCNAVISAVSLKTPQAVSQAAVSAAPHTVSTIPPPKSYTASLASSSSNPTTPKASETGTLALDQEAILLSNKIFNKTTELKVEEDTNGTDAPNSIKEQQGVEKMIQKPENFISNGLLQASEIRHAKQYYVVNTPIQGEQASGGGSNTAPEYQLNITGPSTRCQVSRPAPLESKDVNQHRPANLGPSRFDQPENQISSQNHKTFSGSASITQKNKVTDSPTSILRSENYHKPPRNVTVLDSRTTSPDTVTKRPFASNVRENYALSQSATFSYGSQTAGNRKSEYNRNFNKSPVPFSPVSSADTHGNKHAVHFSAARPHQWAGLSTSATEVSAFPKHAMSYSPPPTLSNGINYGASVTFCESVGHSNGLSSPLSSSMAAINDVSTSSANATNRITHSIISSNMKSSSGSMPGTCTLPSATRAKSEGAAYNQAPISHINHVPSGGISSSAASAELFRQIQVTKERHKADCEKAMNYGSSSALAIAAAWKPSQISTKLPRPGNDYVRYATTNERDKVNRRMERERSILDKILTDRASRTSSSDISHINKT
jgi:hypothetical protein